MAQYLMDLCTPLWFEWGMMLSCAALILRFLKNNYYIVHQNN